MTNQHSQGGNLKVLGDRFNDTSVDLNHLDQPSNANAGYKALFKGPQDTDSAAQPLALRYAAN